MATNADILKNQGWQKSLVDVGDGYVGYSRQDLDEMCSASAMDMLNTAELRTLVLVLAHNMQIFMDEPLVRQDEAARMLDVSHRTMEQWRYRNEGPDYIEISKTAIRYRRHDILRWADTLKRRMLNLPRTGEN